MPEVIRKSELALQVAEALDISKLDANDIVSASLEEIILGLIRDGQVQILGFGSFVKSERAARSGRNPRTGEKIEIAAQHTVVFRPGRKLRESVKPCLK